MSTSNGWKVEHKEDNSYTVECLDFTSREKSVTLKTADQNMTGDVNIAISAKEGSVTANSISYSKDTSDEFTQDNTTDYSNSNIIITLKTKKASAAITEGWLKSDDAKDITVSGDLKVPVPIDTTTNSFVPKKNAQYPSPRSGRYFKNVSIGAVDNLKTKLTGSTNQPSGSGDATEFSMSPFNSIAICGDDDSSIGIQKYNTSQIAFDRDTSNTEEHTFNGTVYCKTKGNNLTGGDFLYTAAIYGPGTYTASINSTSYRYKIQLNVRKVNSNSSLVLGYLYVNTLYEYQYYTKVRMKLNFYYNDKSTVASGEHVEVFTMSPAYDEDLD